MISVFDLFSIGIGPSSSHTVGPMRAARNFANKITHPDLIDKVHYVTVEVHGSLAFTGKGHGTDKAILMGLEGEDPETINPDTIEQRMQAIHLQHIIYLNQKKKITFNPQLHLILNLETLLPKHSNGMSFKAFNAESHLLAHDIYYSIGGGFIIHENEEAVGITGQDLCPYPFNTTSDLMKQCRTHNLSIAQLMLEMKA